MRCEQLWASLQKVGVGGTVLITLLQLQSVVFRKWLCAV